MPQPSSSDAEKLEEDITSLLASPRVGNGRSKYSGAGFRSQYGVSFEQPIAADEKLDKLGKVLEWFRALAKDVPELDRSAKLLLVGAVLGRTYEKAKVDLGKRTAKFDLSLWYDNAGGAPSVPRVV